METALTSAILLAVLILAVVGLSGRAFSSQAAIADVSIAAQEREGERLRTSLTPLSATTDGTSVSFILKNNGSTKLSDFENWDVFLQYSDGATTLTNWYSYGAGSNQWSEQLFMSASSPNPEVIEPGIFNPGEEMLVTVSVSPPAAEHTTGLVTVSTPNGITTSSVFAY